jgi:hypothetical protein
VLDKETADQLQQELEQAWEFNQLPEDFRELYRTLIFSLPPQLFSTEAARHLAELSSGTSPVLISIMAIEAREQSLAGVHKLESSISKTTIRAQHLLLECAEMLHAFRLLSLKVIEAVVVWRKHAYTLQQNRHKAYIKGRMSALPFIWEDTDYLLKMTTDTDWMRSSTLRRYFDFDDDFDPFMVKCSTPIINSQKTGMVVRGNSVQLPMHRKLMQRIHEAEAVLAEESAADEARQIANMGVVPEVNASSHTHHPASPAQVGQRETKQEAQSPTKQDARSAAKTTDEQEAITAELIREELCNELIELCLTGTGEVSTEVGGLLGLVVQEAYSELRDLLAEDTVKLQQGNSAVSDAEFYDSHEVLGTHVTLEVVTAEAGFEDHGSFDSENSSTSSRGVIQELHDSELYSHQSIDSEVSEENKSVKSKSIKSLASASDTVKRPKQRSTSELELNKPAVFVKTAPANEAERLADLLLQGLVNDFLGLPWLDSVAKVQLNEEIHQANIRSQYKTASFALEVPDDYGHIAFTPAIHSPNLYSGLNATRLYSANESEAHEDDVSRSFLAESDVEGKARIKLSHIGTSADFIYRMLKDYFALLQEPVVSSVQSLDDLLKTESQLTTPCWYWVVVNNHIGGVVLFSLDPIAPRRRVEVVHFSTIYLSLYKPCLAYFCDWLWSSDACEELRVRLVSGVRLPGEVEGAFEELNFRAIQDSGSGQRFVSLHRPTDSRFDDASFMSEVLKV